MAQNQSNIPTATPHSFEILERHSRSASELYEAVITGNIVHILAANIDPSRVKFANNDYSMLHLAASVGQARFITDIIPKCSDIVKEQTMDDDLAFHCAAKAASLTALQALTEWETYNEDADIERDLLGWKNNKGDTPLHIALETNQPEMAKYLVEQYGEACYMINYEQVCPLYLAIRAGLSDVVAQMISFTKNSKSTSEEELLLSKSVVHAAIDAKNLDILKQILENHETLIQLVDEKGRTPLSYAAFKGYIEGVEYLLDNFRGYRFVCDTDGSLPIHSAASGGHINVIKKLHNMRYVLDNKGRNILHVAASAGKSEVVSHLLKMREFKSLVNLKDHDGNTPLHLATMNFQPRVVYNLSRREDVKNDLRNKDGMTALDVADTRTDRVSQITFEMRLTYMALAYADTPRSYDLSLRYRQEQIKQGTKNEHRANEEDNIDKFKSRIDTHLLVATLVATVTFAAGFTLPGGYNQSDPGIGMATLVRKWAFKVFVICNTAAMHASILTVVILLWAYLNELKLMLISFRLALRVLGFALMMMSITFMMGVFLVLERLPWLSYLILGMSSFFIFLAMLFLIPLYNPSSRIKTRILRLYFSGTLLLLIFVSDKIKPVLG